MKYNLPPTSPQYLSMTDEDIELEYYIYQEYERKKREIEDSLIPHCELCGYRGKPVAEIICPKCGAEMTIPESDQTTYLDDNPIHTLEEMGVELTEKEKSIINDVNR